MKTSIQLSIKLNELIEIYKVTSPNRQPDKHQKLWLAMLKLQKKLALYSAINEMVEELNTLEPNDLLSPISFSVDTDKEVDELCREFNIL